MLRRQLRARSGWCDVLLLLLLLLLPLLLPLAARGAPLPGWAWICIYSPEPERLAVLLLLKALPCFLFVLRLHRIQVLVLLPSLLLYVFICRPPERPICAVHVVAGLV
jgi:hypothetical protein